MNPFDGATPRTVYEEMLGPRNAHRAAMAASARHFRSMAALLDEDPAAGRERAMWVHLAEEIEDYLSPPVVVEHLQLFPAGPDPPDR